MDLQEQEVVAMSHSKEKPLIAGLVVAVIAAIIGFALFFTSGVPAGAAAKVNDSYVTEERVAEWIAQYRSVYGLTDDDTFASTLKSQNMTVVSYRQNAIDQIILSDLIEARANELGLEATDEEVQAKLESVSGQFASDDESLWASTLESMGVTEDELKVRYKADILQSKVEEADVPLRDASDEELLAYVQSYLAGTTQKHVCRIVFEGDSMSTKAEKCMAELKGMRDAGTFDDAAFAKLAKKYSDEDDVAETGGALAWTGAGVIGDEITEVIEDMDAGEFSELTTIEADDGALEIIYVDETYTFPDASNIASVDAIGVPDELLIAVKSAAAQVAWQSDCSDYLAKMLAGAKITYYPVPDDAAYNVEL